MHELSSMDRPHSTQTWPKFSRQTWDSIEQSDIKDDINYNVQRNHIFNKSYSATHSLSDIDQVSNSTKYRSTSALSTTTSLATDGSLIADPSLFEEVDITLPTDTGEHGRFYGYCLKSTCLLCVDIAWAGCRQGPVLAKLDLFSPHKDRIRLYFQI